MQKQILIGIFVVSWEGSGCNIGHWGYYQSQVFYAHSECNNFGEDPTDSCACLQKIDFNYLKQFNCTLQYMNDYGAAESTNFYETYAGYQANFCSANNNGNHIFNQILC